jgi:quercetin dioxygenase-like cupin family protein
MMDFIESLSEYNLQERNVSSLTVVKAGEGHEAGTQGSFWIMSPGSEATLDSTTSIKNTAWVSMGHKHVSVQGPALVIENPGYEFSERKLTAFKAGELGQLSYIDGCSNSNLIDPPRNGDPCINYLYFPPGIDQTWHTHPSVRIGYVLSGKGYACVKNGDEEQELPLEPGKIFVLHRHAKHRFRTDGDQHMSLMVYHPDSEDGPRDENNPMKSRTYLR